MSECCNQVKLLEMTYDIGLKLVKQYDKYHNK
jgi:hypothetical protein